MPGVRGLALDRWFTRHIALAERACLSLCRWTLMEYPAAVPADWRDMVRSTRVDQGALSAAWQTWRAANPPKAGQHLWSMGDLERHEATAPKRSDYLLATWSREPPIPGPRRWFGDDWKTHPKNRCPVCARPCYAGGDHRPGAGPPRWNKCWHGCCQAIQGIWRDPTWVGRWLAERQGGVCPLTGETLLGEPHPRSGVRGVLGGVQVDHVVPLWRVRHDGADHVWPDVLRFWGPQNLQALSPAGHLQKTAQEARDRARLYAAAPASAQTQMAL